MDRWIALASLLSALVAMSIVPNVQAVAIGVDPTTGTASCGPFVCSGPLVWSHTVGSNANRLLLVGIVQSGFTPVSVASVTYAGIPLTLINSQPFQAFLDSVDMWDLVNPPTGTAMVIVTLGALIERGAAGSVSYFNVGAVGANNFASGTGPHASVSVGSNVGDLVADTLEMTSDPSPTPTGIGQTLRWDSHPSTPIGFGSGSDAPGSASSTTLSWTGGGNPVWGEMAVDLTPTTPAPPIPEYPLGLAVLAIFMIVSYAAIKRRTRC